MIQVVLAELTVRAERDDGATLHVHLTGKSASRDAARELQPVLERVLQAAREENRALELHFERLSYFNSSTIAALVKFLQTARQAGVALVVRYDASLKWQAMSFDALRRVLHSGAGGQPGVRFEGVAG